MFSVRSQDPKRLCYPRRVRFFAGLCVFVTVACARPSRDECAAVVERYVDMRAADDPDVTSAPEARKAEAREASKEKKRRDFAYEARIAQCTREVSRSELACGMSAPTPNEWEACFE